jgi:uncharacterized membrane protein YjfL (UPF0719 family)
MKTKLTLLAIIEILSAVSMGMFILAATYQMLKYYGRKRYDIQHNNLAYGVFMASVLFSVGYMMSSVIDPLLSLFRILANDDRSAVALIGSFLVYGGIYIGASYLLAIGICWVGVQLYTWITPIDEFKELKDNNVSVALVVASILVTLSLLSHDGIALFIESFVPYPSQPPR